MTDESDIYRQGVASLGFNGGPEVSFRINPSDIRWNFKMNTSVTETVGGRVIQVLGAILSDLTVSGSFGAPAGSRRAWDLAEKFLSDMQDMAEYQASNANVQGGGMTQPAIFSFPPRGWRFEVYVKDLVDPNAGTAIQHSPGKFSYDYSITLNIVNDLSNASRVLDSKNGSLTPVKDQAVEEYINRIADGIGWKPSKYNGNFDLGAALPTIDGIPDPTVPGQAGSLPSSTGTASTNSALIGGGDLTGTAQ